MQALRSAGADSFGPCHIYVCEHCETIVSNVPSASGGALPEGLLADHEPSRRHAYGSRLNKMSIR